MLGKPTISGDLAAHPFAGVQHGRVIAAEPAADLHQARAVQHHSEMAGQHDARQAASAEKLLARQIELLGDDVLNELER